MKSSGTFKLIVVFLVALPVIALFGSPDETSSNATLQQIAVTSSQSQTPAPTDKGSKDELIDYSAPTYTTSFAVVCPMSIAWDKREGYGLVGASQAAASVFGRSERLEKVGCVEWREGIRIHINESEKDASWQRFSDHADGPADKIIFRPYITNRQAGT